MVPSHAAKAVVRQNLVSRLRITFFKRLPARSAVARITLLFTHLSSLQRVYSQFFCNWMSTPSAAQTAARQCSPNRTAVPLPV